VTLHICPDVRIEGVGPVNLAEWFQVHFDRVINYIILFHFCDSCMDFALDGARRTLASSLPSPAASSTTVDVGTTSSTALTAPSTPPSVPTTSV
jgi:hypothetical protein